MPLYELRCECGHHFEVRKPMHEGPPKTCPQCKEETLRQVFEKPPAFHTHYSPMHPRAKRGRGY